MGEGSVAAFATASANGEKNDHASCLIPFWVLSRVFDLRQLTVGMFIGCASWVRMEFEEYKQEQLRSSSQQ